MEEPTTDLAIRTATRSQLNGLTELVSLDELTGEARTNLLASASRIWNEPAFRQVLDQLMMKQTEFSMLEAADWEQVKFGRATVLGVGLVRDEFERLETQFKELSKPEEEFDKHAVI